MGPERDSEAPPAGGFGEPKPGSNLFGPIRPEPARANPPHAFHCAMSSFSLTLVVLIGVGFAAILLFGFHSAAGNHFFKRAAESRPCAEK